LIFITAKFRVRPEHADEWIEIAKEFTQATRNEAGCMWFEWSRSVEAATEYVLVEAFRDHDAGIYHVQSDHFKSAQRILPSYLAETPRIINAVIPQDGWSSLGEMAVEDNRVS